MSRALVFLVAVLCLASMAAAASDAVFCNDYYYCPKTYRCCVFGFYACCRNPILPDGSYGKSEIIHATRVQG